MELALIAGGLFALLMFLNQGKAPPGGAIDPATGAAINLVPPGVVPNYPASTPDSVPTGIAGAMASAYKPPEGAAAAAAPPLAGIAVPNNTQVVGDPVASSYPVASTMGGASWPPPPPAMQAAWTQGVLASGGTIADAQALIDYAASIPPITTPTVETRTGRGHF